MMLTNDHMDHLKNEDQQMIETSKEATRPYDFKINDSCMFVGFSSL
jgi:hypothetical protein